MPFTLSHPAAVIPLTRRGLVPSALIVGSMAPDFEYFLRLSTGHSFGHTLPGLCLLTLPLGLIVLWIFHTLLKQPLLSLLPHQHQVRLYLYTDKFHFAPPSRFFIIILSLLIGALSHIVWDAFTHESSWLVQQTPLFQASILTTPQGTLKVHKLLQHSSTLLGAGLLVYWYLAWFRYAPEQRFATAPNFSPLTKLGLIILIFGGAAILAGVYSWLTASPIVDLQTLRTFVGQSIVVSVAILFLESVLFGLIWHILSANSKPRSS